MGAEWLILIGMQMAALASPGPDFVMAIRNSLYYGRAKGIITALGFAVGIIFHVLISLAGIGVLLSQSIMLFTALKIIGAAYLVYIGYKAMKSKGFDQKIDEGAHSNSKTIWSAFMDGFITNILNPKAMLFFFALFSQILSPDLPLQTQILYMATCSGMTFAWFSAVAVFMTTKPVRRGFMKISKWVDRVCGVFFVGLGIKLLLAKSS